MKIKTSELEGAALDWAVAKAVNDLSIVYHEGRPAYEEEFDPCNWKNYDDMKRFVTGRYFEPSKFWDQAGPLIEERITCMVDTEEGCYADTWAKAKCYAIPLESFDGKGSTMLIAAMRAIVASELGGEVDVPDEVAV